MTRLESFLKHENMSHLSRTALHFRSVMRRIGPQIGKVAIPGGPSHAEHLLLGFLVERGEMTPGAMALLAKVKPQSIGQTLDAMSERGWISRRHGGEDRRLVHVAATDLGREVFLKLKQARQEWVETLLSRLSESELDTVEKALEILEKVAAPMTSHADAPAVAESAPDETGSA